MVALSYHNRMAWMNLCKDVKLVDLCSWSWIYLFFCVCVGGRGLQMCSFLCCCLLGLNIQCRELFRSIRLSFNVLMFFLKKWIHITPINTTDNSYQLNQLPPLWFQWNVWSDNSEIGRRKKINYLAAANKQGWKKTTTLPFRRKKKMV